MAVTASGSSSRRVVFGLNALLQAVAALAVVGLAIFAAQRAGWQADLTRTGSNSLSPRTKALLKGLDQNVRITGIYTVLSEYDTRAQKRQAAVKDLLSLYQTVGGAHVSSYMIDPMKEPGSNAALLERLRNKSAYVDEAKPHAEAIQKFPPLREKIEKLASEDADQIRKLAEANPALTRVKEIRIIFSNLSIVARDAKDTEQDLNELLKGDVPRYGRAMETARKLLTSAKTSLTAVKDWAAGEGAAAVATMPDALAFFQGVRGRYEPLLAEIDAMLSATEKLKEVKLEELYAQLVNWTTSPPILVETDSEARVVGFFDAWVPRSDANAPPSPDGDDKEFNGEAAVSSAILALTQKDKTAVVFTRYGGESLIRPDFSRANPMMGQMPRAPLQEMNDQLTKANFVTEEWNVQESKTPPEIPDVKRRVYVIFPPEPPQQPNPMRPQPQAGITPEDKQAVLAAIGDSGSAIFLTGFAQPASPMMMAAPTYEWGDYLKTSWGIDADVGKLVVEFVANPQKPNLWMPAGREATLASTDVSQLVDHPITKPILSMPGAFPNSCPVRPVSKDAPAGVKVQPLVEIPASERVWAIGDLMRVEQDLQQKQGTTRGEQDITGPFPIAVAASNDKNQKVVVFGSESFVLDQVAQNRSVGMSGSGFVQYLTYPANADLLLNSLYWLTDDAGRISVGPRSAQVPRLSGLKPGFAADFWQYFLLGGMPAVALLVGGAVWMVRRK